MNQSDTSHLETDPPRDRLSRLSEASLRINETLEFDKVLQEVVDSARATLTGARYGMMATLNESGGAGELLKLRDYRPKSIGSWRRRRGHSVLRAR